MFDTFTPVTLSTKRLSDKGVFWARNSDRYTTLVIYILHESADVANNFLDVIAKYEEDLWPNSHDIKGKVSVVRLLTSCTDYSSLRRKLTGQQK